MTESEIQVTRQAHRPERDKPKQEVSYTVAHHNPTLTITEELAPTYLVIRLGEFKTRREDSSHELGRVKCYDSADGEIVRFGCGLLVYRMI